MNTERASSALLKLNNVIGRMKAVQSSEVPPLATATREWVADLEFVESELRGLTDIAAPAAVQAR